MIYDTLYDWQKNIVDKNKNRKAYGLFLGCGLGKTLISLAFSEVNECTKILIITLNSKVCEPESKSGSWYDWIRKMDIEFNISKKSKFDFNVNGADVYITNFESICERGLGKEANKRSKIVLKEAVKQFIESCKGHNVTIIIDESHKMKDGRTLQTQAIQLVQKMLNVYSKNCYCYLLTGTPFTKDYMDLYTQLKFLGWDKTKTYFRDNFCILGSIRNLLPWQQPVVGYKNIEYLYEIVHKYAITLESKDVIDLPETIYNYIKLPQSEDMTMFLAPKCNSVKLKGYCKKRGIKEEFLYGNNNNPFYRDIDFNGESGRWLAETAGTMWLRARQLSAGFNGNAEEYDWFDDTRLKELEHLLEDNPNNYIIFYNYTPELYKIYDICDKLGYNIDVYCGEIKSLKFYERYENQTLSERVSNNKNVIVSNFASGSTGMNWQAYNQCIVFSLPIYRDWIQGLARIHRNGQKQTCVYNIFYQDNWVERSMIKALESKIDYNEKMFKNDLEMENEVW